MSFHPLIIEFFLIYLAMAQNRGRIHTKDFVEVSKGPPLGGLDIALPGRAQMTYLGRKRLYGRLRGYRETMQINEKINFIQDSFQKVFQHCKSTSH